MHKQDFKIKYKTINNADNVLAALQLRYITYRHVNYISENRDMIDVDPYDFYSTFLGAYYINSEKETLVGTMRIIGSNENCNASSYVREIVASAKSEEFKALQERPMPYPIMESFALPSDFLRVKSSAGSEDSETNNLYEISRLAVRPDFWFRRIDIGLHHLLILDTWLDHPQRRQFMVAIHPRSQSRYERIGMHRIPGTGQVLYKHLDQLAVAMTVDMETLLRVAPGYRESCEADYAFFDSKKYFLRNVTSRMPKKLIDQDMIDIESQSLSPIKANKILVVDNDPSVVSAIIALLRTKFEDYEVEGAINGYEALLKIGEFKPSLLILDIKMSQIDGLEVISRIRANKTNSNLKIIAMTGHSEAYPENAVLSAGANDYLLKPFGYKILLNLAKAHLE